jgi:hypothetical protein
VLVGLLVHWTHNIIEHEVSPHPVRQRALALALAHAPVSNLGIEIGIPVSTVR